MINKSGDLFSAFNMVYSLMAKSLIRGNAVRGSGRGA